MKVTGYQFRDHANPGKQLGRNGVDEVHLIQILSGILLCIFLYLEIMDFRYKQDECCQVLLQRHTRSAKNILYL